MNEDANNPLPDNIKLAWNDDFPPLNLWNWPWYQVKEIFYKDKNVRN